MFASDMLLIQRYMAVSSAKSLTPDLTCSGRSFMYARNKMGPRTEPWHREEEPLNHHETPGCTLLYVHSSIAIILMGKRELIALLNLSSWCLVMVERLFLTVPRGCLQFVIVVFPDHTHLLFLYQSGSS